MENKKYLIEVPNAIIKNMDITPVKNVEEVLTISLTKNLKRVDWVEVETLSNKSKSKSAVSSRH